MCIFIIIKNSKFSNDSATPTLHQTPQNEMSA